MTALYRSYIKVGASLCSLCMWTGFEGPSQSADTRLEPDEPGVTTAGWFGANLMFPVWFKKLGSSISHGNVVADNTTTPKPARICSKTPKTGHETNGYFHTEQETDCGLWAVMVFYCLIIKQFSFPFWWGILCTTCLIIWSYHNQHYHHHHVTWDTTVTVIVPFV